MQHDVSQTPARWRDLIFWCKLEELQGQEGGGAEGSALLRGEGAAEYIIAMAWLGCWDAGMKPHLISYHTLICYDTLCYAVL